MNEIEKHISIIERMMFAFATSTVDKKPIFPTLKYCKEALQEKLERENPQEDCKYCNGKSYHDRELIQLHQSHDFAEIVIDSDNALYISNEDIDLSINTAEISYCPMCGRKLTKHIGEANNAEGE